MHKTFPRISMGEVGGHWEKGQPIWLTLLCPMASLLGSKDCDLSKLSKTTQQVCSWLSTRETLGHLSMNTHAHAHECLIHSTSNWTTQLSPNRIMPRQTAGCSGEGTLTRGENPTKNFCSTQQHGRISQALSKISQTQKGHMVPLIEGEEQAN